MGPLDWEVLLQACGVGFAILVVVPLAFVYLSGRLRRKG